MSEWQMYDEPCPFCGGLSFTEYTTEKYRVEVVNETSDDTTDYTIDDMIVKDSNINEVWCAECDAPLIEHAGFNEYL